MILQTVLWLTLLLLILTPHDAYVQDMAGRVDGLVGTRQFDFLVWEVEAFLEKGQADLAAGHIYLDDEARKEIVLEYLAALDQVRRWKQQLEVAFVDPNAGDPDAASQRLQTQIAWERARIERFQPLAEAIIQEQVAAVLLDEGFGVLGHAWPPVRMHMTPLPALLVVSPRDVIRREHSVSLEQGLLAPERSELEAAVLERLNHAAYVTDIGGLGTYPAMIVETSNINFLVEVVAHEWAHHWLTLYPLGLNYEQSNALRTINESTANILGKEIGAEVVRRYYPEYVPQPPSPELPETPPPDPPPFDFRVEMAETRIHVDALLAEGKVAEAEAYMEAQRQLFIANGYQLRVLNQAYFAFHGAYADVIGAAGADPVGPLVVQIRESSGSLRAFMDNVAFVTSFEELEAVADRLALPAE